MVVSLHVAADIRFEIRVADDVFSGKAFRPSVFASEGALIRRQSPPHAFNQDPDVVGVGQIVGVDKRRLERIAGRKAKLPRLRGRMLLALRLMWLPEQRVPLD